MEEGKRLAEINARLKAAVLRHMDRPGLRPSAVEGLTLVRYDSPDSLERCFQKPVASIVVQGSKCLVVGTREYHFCEDQCLVSCVDMPSMASTLEASPEKPFLSLFIELNRKTLADLMLEMEPEGSPAGLPAQGTAIADADPEFLEGMLRLAELLDKPKQIAVRAPIILRELHYLLLIGPQGGLLQNLYMRGSQRGQIVQAIALMKQNLASPLQMESLARQVGMSLSSLHRHFKSVTGFSPLQYHKQLRLYEARRLMLMEDERASGAALAVGYESIAQFTREYKRMFGESPRRDIARRRTLAGQGLPAGEVLHGEPSLSDG